MDRTFSKGSRNVTKEPFSPKGLRWSCSLQFFNKEEGTIKKKKLLISISKELVFSFFTLRRLLNTVI